MEQIFRIEIPVEAVDNTDGAALQRLETTLNKIGESVKNSKRDIEGVFEAIESGASEAKTSMKAVETAFDGATDGLEEAANAAGDVENAYEDAGDAAQGAGRKSGSAFDTASANMDKFSQRMEKSNKSLRDMFKEKLQLTLAAVDRASPIIKNVWNSAKSLAGKTWNVAVRMKDFITAPFRKLWNMISNPITMALSVAGLGLSANELVTTFNNFETGMSAVRSLTGATNEDFTRLTDTAKSLGATTSFSATEASDGMQYLAMAGWDTNEIIAAMPGLLDLAAAGSTDLGVAADIVSDVMTAMGMSAEQASHAADIFAKTATSSNTTIEGLGDTLKYAAPIAHSFGMSLEEVAAVAGMMGDAGIKGSQAGTAMRSALLRMADPVPETVELLDKLGLSFKNTDGSMRSMSQIISDTKGAFSGLSDSERLAAAQTIFGTEAASAWLAVIEQGPDVYDEFTASLRDSTGAAKDMAEIRLDNLAGDITLLQSAAEGLKIDLMSKLSPIARQAVQWLTAQMPEIDTFLTGTIDKILQKAQKVKSAVTEVFDSAQFRNADGFTEKFFIAWDKLIADPFAKWWDGGGEEKIIGKIGEIGEGAGEMLNGVITGIFAALTGKEIDFEGLNISGIAKAGAEAAKEFVSSFLGGLNIPDLFGEAPGMMKAGLLGFGALKIGGGVGSAVRTLGALKTALAGTGNAATIAAPAVAAVGQGAAASAAGLGSTTSMLGLVAKGLSAIPAWGWVAAAALTATVVGVKMYTDAQRENQFALEDSNEATAAAIENYRESAQAYSEFSDTFDTYKAVQIKIESSGENREVTEDVRGMLEDIEDRTVLVKAMMSETSTMTPEEIDAAFDEMIGLKEREIQIKASLDLQGIDATELTNIVTEIQNIEDRKAEIELAISKGGLTKEQLENLQTEWDGLESREAQLNLMLDKNGLTLEEASALVKELQEIKDRRSDIIFSMADSEMKPEAIIDVVGYLDSIADKSAQINISMADGSVDVKALNEQLDELRGNLDAQLVQSSGGVYTQADADAGRITDEDREAYVEHLRKQAETDLYNALAAANESAELVPDTIARRDAAQAKSEEYGQAASDKLAEKRFLGELEDRRALLLAQYQSGAISMDEMLEGGVKMKQDYLDYYNGRTGPINMESVQPEDFFGSFSWGKYKTGDTGIFTDAIDWLNTNQGSTDSHAAESQGVYERENEALKQNYQNQKAVIESFSFNGSDYAGMTLEEVAKHYAELDDAGKKMFEDAVMALNELNAQTDYLSDEDKTQAVDIVDLAAKAEIMANVQTQVQTIAADYGAMSEEQQAAFAASEEGAAQLAAINEALAGLGLDQIGSLDELSGALEAIASVDLSSFSLEDVQQAFSALGTDADGTKTQVEYLRAALTEMDGMHTTSTHTHTNLTLNRTISIAGGRVSMNAEGGIYDGAMLSWVAEDGPEAIIPLGADRRDRGLELWLAAGKMLGVNEFAEGGIAAPYSGALEKLPDDFWHEDTDGGGGEPKPVHAGGNGGGGGGRAISVSVASNPVYHIDGGGSGEEIVAKIKEHQQEIAEILAGSFADQLEDICSNIS